MTKSKMQLTPSAMAKLKQKQNKNSITFDVEPDLLTLQRLLYIGELRGLTNESWYIDLLELWKASENYREAFTTVSEQKSENPTKEGKPSYDTATEHTKWFQAYRFDDKNRKSDLDKFMTGVVKLSELRPCVAVPKEHENDVTFKFADDFKKLDITRLNNDNEETIEFNCIVIYGILTKTLTITLEGKSHAKHTRNQ